MSRRRQMIDKIKLIRNVGRFDSYAAEPGTNFKRLTLVYGENARGKTTLAEILRSLASGNPFSIAERARLGTPNPQHVVIELTDGATCVFQNGSWSQMCPDLFVFDDAFVDENVHAGLSVGASHRQNLHQVIIGRKGVTLAHRFKELTERIAQQQNHVRDRESAIPSASLGGLSVEVFCALPEQPGIEDELAQAEKRVTAFELSDTVEATPLFEPFAFPVVPIDDINATLAKSLVGVNSDASAAVQDHFASLGKKGEEWVSQGAAFARMKEQKLQGDCPFCGQTLTASELARHYEAYFGDAYRAHKQAIKDQRRAIVDLMGQPALSRFQQDVERARQRYDVWKNMLTLPGFTLNLAAASETWQTARNQLLEAVDTKIASPLEPVSFDTVDLASYSRTSEEILGLSRSLVAMNEAIEQLKAETAVGDLNTARRDVDRLKATKERHKPDVAKACEEYIAAKDEKTRLEDEKAQCREELDEHREEIFPRYQVAINTVLQKFNADFRIVDVQPANPRGTPSSHWFIEIGGQNVPLAPEDETTPSQSFRNTLSSGDRNTLALAFFFAQLQLDANLSDCVVVIDDPASSHDDGRSLVTAQELRCLVDDATQLVLMSHRKSLLCSVWEHTDPADAASIEVRRSPTGSTIQVWDINDAAITEYDRGHQLLRDYHAGRSTDSRSAAIALRRVLEGFLRTACVEHCPPGTLLGPFINHARQLLANGNPILSQTELDELDQIKEYANKFHHDTNPAWDTEVANINDTLLNGYVTRVLTFTRK